MLVKESISFERGGNKRLTTKVGVGIRAKQYYPSLEDWLDSPSGIYVVKREKDFPDEHIERPYFKVFWNQDTRQFVSSGSGAWAPSVDRAMDMPFSGGPWPIQEQPDGPAFLTGEKYGGGIIQVEWKQLKELDKDVS